jgi:hypothetical protein
MPHHNNPAVPDHSHVAGGDATKAHGFITLHATTNQKAGQGKGRVDADHDPGVSTTMSMGLVIALVVDTQNVGMNPFHTLLETLATKYKGYGFDFEHHF